MARRYYRRRGRRPRRRYTWVRGSHGSTGTLASGSVVLGDMLWNARQPPTSGAAIQDAWRVEPAVAPNTNVLPTLDLQDVMIERVLGEVNMTYTIGTTTALNAAIYVGVSTDTGLNMSTNADTGPQSTYGSVDPKNFPQIVSTSWMMWVHANIFDPRYTIGEIGTGKNSLVVPINIRSRRRLKDWGDSLLMITSGFGLGDATNIAYEAVYSVLLSHR